MSANFSPNSYRTALADLVKAIEDGMGSLDMWDQAYKAAKAALELPLDGPSWRMCDDSKDGPECKGVHFLRHEAAKGGEVCVTAMHHGAFYEIRFKVPPFATGTPQEKT